MIFLVTGDQINLSFSSFLCHEQILAEGSARNELTLLESKLGVTPDEHSFQVPSPHDLLPLHDSTRASSDLSCDFGTNQKASKSQRKP